MVQDGADETTVPEEGLEGEVVYAKGAAELDVRDGLVERKVRRKKGDENVATRPIFDIWRGEEVAEGEGRGRTFVEDDLVTKDLDFDCATRPLDETCEDLTHRL